MNVVLAPKAGFCFGVERAIKSADAVEGGNTYMLGRIINNKIVVGRFLNKGVKFASELSEVEPGSNVIISSHGVGKDIYERLDAMDAEITDTTCPFVKKIHTIAEECFRDGYKIIVFGDKNHAEVKGICGFCDYTASVFADANELDGVDFPGGKIAVVSQTTASVEKWNRFKNAVLEKAPEAKIFNTICSATEERQSACANLAAQADYMIIVGDSKSSNTMKLFELSSRYCKSCLVENSDQIPFDELEKLKSSAVIGVGAGASAPADIINGVVSALKEHFVESNIDFENQIDESMKALSSGEVVRGKVVYVRNSEIFVDLGYKFDGVIASDELSFDPSAKAEDIAKPGDEVDVYVVKINENEGMVYLSLKRVTQMKAYDNLQHAFENKEIISGNIVQSVNGGVAALTPGGIRVFIPASLACADYVSDMKSLVGTEVRFRIIELDVSKRKIVGSVKAVAIEEKEAKEKEFWDSAKVSDVREGVVSSIASFGAFVDLGGVKGLIHLSEMSWGKIKSPEEIFKVGDKVQVYIKDLDHDKKRISLGYRREEDNPWFMAAQKLHNGDIVECRVERIASFGAFVKILEPDVNGAEGLMHISQIANHRVEKIDDEISVGEQFKAKILDMDAANKKISLSRKVLLEDYSEEKTQPES